jgi:hypothetical protein
VRVFAAKGDESLWHKCPSPVFPRRTVDGGWTEGWAQTWRRKIDGKWQYRQDEETFEEQAWRSAP